MKALATAVCCLAAPLLVGAADAQTVSVITTPSGSFTNSAGAAIAKVITEKSKVRAIIQAQAASAVISVQAGTGEFGMGNSFDTTFYVTGTGEYEGQGPKTNVRNIGPLSVYRVAMHVRADSSIKTLKDLKGKRVSAGFNAQKAIGRIIDAHLANAGLTYDDVQKVLTPNVSSSANDFIAGKTDVLFFALGSAAIKQASASVGGLRVLPIEDSPEALERMEKVLPGSYVLNVKPAPNIDGLKEPTNIVAFDMAFFTNKDVADDIVYTVTKTLHNNKAALVATFRPMALFDPARMGKPLKAVPFHPGALKYYQEVGLASKS
ncbi:MAG: TAXI family TRAP transporter solute-binding subunit [Rhizobiales bacterium]|nr:TAXI family TRAP transporter solute-binding subunit [Hyphomicrobiales bacterium]